MNSDVEEIKSRLNVVDVLGEYLRLEKAGANWKARCPFHNEKTPSFMVNEEKQIWHCFGCQKGGDVFGFVMEIESLEFKEALKLLADKAGVQLQKWSGGGEAKKSRTLEILELATKFYEVQLWKGDGQTKITSYLKERGLTEESIKNFRLGYAPRGWRNLLEFLTKRGYLGVEIEKTGLLVKKAESEGQNPTNYKLQTTNYYDRFRDRIIFPVMDTMGKVVGFSARVAPGGDESQAKYVNTPESEVYHKSRVLYGLSLAKGEIKSQDSVLLVEGNMDVIAAAQAGIKNVVAVSGTALTKEQVDMIKRYTNNVRMFFDMDKAGEAATKKSIELCFAKDMNVKVVELTEGKDAAELVRNNPNLLKKAIEDSAPAMEYFFKKSFSKKDLAKAENQKTVAQELLEMISQMASDIEKSHWIRELAERMKIKEGILTDLLKKVTLKGKIVETSKKQAAEENFSSKTKRETLLDDLAGFLLVYGDIWKKAFLEEKGNEILLADNLLNILLTRGEEFEFNFDKLVKTIGDPNEKNRIERLFFEKKYRLGLNNEIEEVLIANPEAEFRKCLEETTKESAKAELEKIEQDLKVAEKSKDKNAVAFLRKEFKRISKQLSL